MTACCRDCGARLSRYAPAGTAYCATHEPAHLEHADLTPVPLDRGVCKRGHNLAETGYVRNKGGGKTSRKCRACHNHRQATYRQRRKAAA